MHVPTRRIIPLLLVALACLESSSTMALERACERGVEPSQQADATSLRARASRFAPRLAIRFWFRAQGDARHDSSLTAAALTAAPKPVGRDASLTEPYGWHVGLRWNLVDMADSAGLLAHESPRLTPTRCLDSRDSIDLGGQP